MKRSPHTSGFSVGGRQKKCEVNSDKSSARFDNNSWVSKQYSFSPFVINTFMELAQKKKGLRNLLDIHRSFYANFYRESGVAGC